MILTIWINPDIAVKHTKTLIHLSVFHLRDSMTQLFVHIEPHMITYFKQSILRSHQKQRSPLKKNTHISFVPWIDNGMSQWALHAKLCSALKNLLVILLVSNNFILFVTGNISVLKQSKIVEKHPNQMQRQPKLPYTVSLWTSGNDFACSAYYHALNLVLSCFALRAWHAWLIRMERW